MQGFGYSVKQHFAFSGKELNGVFWTSLAFAFIVTFRKWGTGENVDVASGIINLIIALAVVFACMWAHVAVQKLIGIRLGYKVIYSHWVNGILLSVFLAFLSLGYIIFILPGSVMIEQITSLRLGKFRYGTNLKDVARIALAGPLTHVLIIMIIGIVYFAAGKPESLLAVIGINLFLAIYSMLPIPKIDVPTKMDGGCDGLGIFFFSRTLFVLVFVTLIIFAILAYTATHTLGLGWLFIIACILGSVTAFIYSVTIEQKN